MARLLAMPCLPARTEVEPISGPNARNSGANTVADGSEQTFDHVGDVVALRLPTNALEGRQARRERGWMTAFLGGANATRIDFLDADRMTTAEAGGIVSGAWTEGAWTEGAWGEWLPRVPLAVAASFNAGTIRLTDRDWGHALGIGDYVGFEPFHFGLYAITAVIAPGHYRIWPRLRKALTADDFATLTPVLAMRPIAPVRQTRGLAFTEPATIDLVEVFDYHARAHFGDFA